jgi:uncharacterized protein (TIGR02001 family)
MKKISLAVLSALAIASTAVVAEEEKSDGYEISGYLTGTNNFMYRGVSLSKNSAAIQGEVQLSLDSGFYTSVWASNTSLGSSIFEYGGPGLEGNFRAGYANKINDDFSFDVGYLRTFYPGTKQSGGNLNLDFNDFYATIFYKNFSAGVSYSDDFFGETGSALYTFAEFKAPIIDKLSLRALVGYTKNSSSDFLRLFGAPASNWTHYIVGLSYPLPKDLEIAGEFHGVDSNGNDAFKAKGFGANRFVFNLTKNF